MTRPEVADAPAALACAEAHPLAPDVLCARHDGHSGTHSSDGTAAWCDVDEPNDPDRRTP